MSAPTQEINFADNFAPPLTDGTYTLTLSQTTQGITDGPSIPDFQKTFAVTGVHFSLPDQDVYSTFPPANTQGHYVNCLPHMVFTRTTLPWERIPTTSQNNSLPLSWLALFVFTESNTPQIQKGAIHDLLLSSTPNGPFLPTPTLDSWESDSDICQVIDIPTTLFLALSPSLNDLQYLAHGRQITDVTNKVIQGDQLSPGEFSVIFANRIAYPNETDGTITVHLISLEGWGDYLPEGPSTKTIPADHVRLVTLYSWSFQSIEDQITFSQYMQNLNISPSSLYLSSPNASDYVKNALEMGYYPLNHQTRLGDQSVSWYRGPLVPYAIPQTTVRSTETFSPDDSVSFDPSTGLLDISYAAAFQLGQLLALQNKSIAIAIYEWKRQLKSQIIKQALRSTDRTPSAIETFLKNRLNFETLLETPPISDTLNQWICNLILLKGIPFHYLVPDENYLPPESLRFFNFDYNWIQNLIFGAFSLGKQTPSDILMLEAFLPQVFQNFQSQTRYVRPSKLGINLTSPNDPVTTITGFLLRSQVVSGWPGLEVYGYPDPIPNPPPVDLGTALKLKMELLAPGILLCLFEGPIGAVKFQEPSEGIHFGVEDEQLEKSQLVKELKYPLNYPQAGTVINPVQSVQAPVRASDPYVIEVAQFNQTLLQALQKAGFSPSTPPSTSGMLSPSNFALQMTQGVEYVIFSNPQPKK